MNRAFLNSDTSRGTRDEHKARRDQDKGRVHARIPARFSSRGRQEWVTMRVTSWLLAVSWVSACGGGADSSSRRSGLPPEEPRRCEP